MYHYFTQKQQRRGAMEPETISKNGVSPKNQRSRENFYAKQNILLLLLFICIPVFLFAQKNGTIGIYTINGNSNWGKGYKVITWVEPETNELYVKNNQLKYGDIITHVDGNNTYQMDATEFSNLCRGEIGTEAELTILRMGNVEPIKIRIERKPDYSVPGEYYFANEVVRQGGPTDSYRSFAGTISYFNKNNSDHQVLSDKEVDFWNYKTFDFEYNNQQQPLVEKDLASIIEKELESKGLRRDKDNPDILVFIDFYNDKKEQYVPPTEQLHTRYQTVYNPWTKRMETRQHIESSTTGNYTKSDYLTMLDIVFMDAEKAKDGNNKVPPVIWNAKFETTTSQGTTILTQITH